MYETISLSVVLSAFLLAQIPAQSAETLSWTDWGDAAFARAKSEKKLVILDLEAVWCHWCHVMDQKTYADPKVADLLRKHFVTIRVDQDSRPDLSRKYEDFGWPATVFFDASGKELAIREGFVAPENMQALIEKLVKKPEPEKGARPPAAVQFSEKPLLSPKLRQDLLAKHVSTYDDEQKGWGKSHKFLDWNSTEYAMSQAALGDAKNEKMARDSLEAQEALLDQVWGGVYQYSTDGDWKHPHFEKIMEMQAGNLRIYSLAYAQWKDPRHLKMAQSIRGYLKTFLTSPDGAFYTTQDADLEQGKHSDDFFALGDRERRQKGIPRIDTHVYSRENGWAISALTTLYAATGDFAVLTDAERATDWISKNRTLPNGGAGGGFRHGEKDIAGPFLGDTLAMARAYLDLYSVTADRAWLAKAQTSAAFIDQTFQFKGKKVAGYSTSPNQGKEKQIAPDKDENLAALRFFVRLHQFTGKKSYQESAERSMRFLATPSVALEYRSGGVLLGQDELSLPPLHLTVVASKKDSNARSLFLAALAYPGPYKRVEWWDRAEGPMPNPDVTYPEMAKPAAYACGSGRCSLPVFKTEDLAKRVAQMTGAHH